MIRQPFASEADRLEYARWVRAVAIIYSGVGLILFGLILFGGPLGVVAPDQLADRVVASAAVSGAHGTVRPAACRGRDRTGCPAVPAGE